MSNKGGWLAIFPHLLDYHVPVANGTADLYLTEQKDFRIIVTSKEFQQPGPFSVKNEKYTYRK